MATKQNKLTMTTTTQIKKQAYDQDYIKDTILLVKAIENRFLDLGERLYNIKEGELWSSTHSSFNEFLAEAGVRHGMASMLVKVYRTYVVEGKKSPQELAGVGYSNLYEAVPLIESKGLDGAIALATTLTRSEVIQEAKEGKHGKHDCLIGEERWGVCKTCGRFIRVEA